MSNLKSIINFCKEIHSKLGKINILIINSGLDVSDVLEKHLRIANGFLFLTSEHSKHMIVADIFMDGGVKTL